MATTIQQIDTWRAARSEHQRLEFKEAKAQFDNRKLYKYCVALANEGGGHLLLGIEDQPPRRVVGTAEREALITLTPALSHWEKEEDGRWAEAVGTRRGGLRSAQTMSGPWGSGLPRVMGFPWASADGFRRSLGRMPCWGGRIERRLKR